MEIRVLTSLLTNSLNKIDKALPTNASNQSLTGILIRARENELYLTATNSDILIETKLDNYNCLAEGKTLIPGKKFVEIVKRLTGQFITISSDKNTITIKCDKSKFNLRPLSLEQFPSRKSIIWNLDFELNGLDFVNLVKKTIISTSESKSMLALNGVNFKTKDNKLYAYASDSFRASKYAIDIENKEEIDVIIPATSLTELIKIVNDDVINIKLSKSMALFDINNTQFETRLIESNFPNVEQFYNNLHQTVINEFDKNELKGAIERASILNAGETNILNFDINRLEAKITTPNNEIGNANETITTKGENDNLIISISSDFLLDAIKTFEDKNIKFYFEGRLKRFVMQSDEDKNLQQLILPVRVA